MQERSNGTGSDGNRGCDEVHRGRTTTSWADVLVKKVHANLPKQWKAEIIFYEDGGDDDDDDDDDDDKKEEDGDEDDNGKRKREGKSKRTKRAATTNDTDERVCEESGEFGERW